MTPEEAIRRLREDPTDHLAWESFYLGSRDVLLAYVSSLLFTFGVAGKETAEDIVHQAITAFLEKWPQIRRRVDSSAAAMAYLRKSCRNAVVDRYRSAKGARQMIVFLTLDFREAFGDESDFIRPIFVEEIAGRLPAECGNLLRIYVLEGLSLADMAERENSSPAAFYSKWYRCMEQAKRIILARNRPINRS